MRHVRGLVRVAPRVVSRVHVVRVVVVRPVQHVQLIQAVVPLGRHWRWNYPGSVRRVWFAWINFFLLNTDRTEYMKDFLGSKEQNKEHPKTRTFSDVIEEVYRAKGCFMWINFSLTQYNGTSKDLKD